MRKWRELTPRIMESPLLLRKFFLTLDREKKHLQVELAKVQGLMPLLMKPRNNLRWSEQDKAELLEHLKRLASLSPYIAAVFLPGGFAMLPILAWWLDRRRGRRLPQPA